MVGVGRDGDCRDWVLPGVPWLTPLAHPSHMPKGDGGGGGARMAASARGRQGLHGHLLLPLLLPVVPELSQSLPWGGEVLWLVGIRTLQGPLCLLSLRLSSVLSACPSCPLLGRCNSLFYPLSFPEGRKREGWHLIDDAVWSGGDTVDFGAKLLSASGSATSGLCIASTFCKLSVS